MSRALSFSPSFLMSADAAKNAFAVLRDKLEESGSSAKKKEKIILATVKGDIHDIGKNIVKVLLENYSFDVIDMGKDVPPEDIVRRALDEDVRLVGLSALMTTTVGSMEETIRQLREENTGLQSDGWRRCAEPGVRGYDRGGLLWERRHAVCLLRPASV